MPNIENLKKQAKQYLRWHREGYYPVAAQIRSTLPNFRGMGDVEVLKSGFKLADAQELVARQEGFDSWQALISGVDIMKETPKQILPRAPNKINNLEHPKASWKRRKRDDCTHFCLPPFKMLRIQ